MDTKLLVLLLLMIVLLSGCITQETTTTTTVTKITTTTTTSTTTIYLITKSPEEMLPTRADIPTEFIKGEIEDTTVDASGFESGKSLSFIKSEGTYGAIGMKFSVNKFSNENDAVSYYHSIVNSIKEKGGYTELKVDYVAPATKCFSFKSDYGFEARDYANFCVKNNVFFTITASSVYSFTNIEGYFKDATKVVDGKVN